MSKVIVFMADGMEMCECLITVDLLRRAGVEVTTASVMGRKEILPSHKVPMTADALAEELEIGSADMIVLPGGRVGTENLAASEIIRKNCCSFAEAGKYVAAICAAPSVLSGLGLLEGKKATCHPDFADVVKSGCAELTGESAVVDGNIITGQGLGATFDFALALVTLLEGAETAARISKGICYK